MHTFCVYITDEKTVEIQADDFGLNKDKVLRFYVFDEEDNESNIAVFNLDNIKGFLMNDTEKEGV